MSTTYATMGGTLGSAFSPLGTGIGAGIGLVADFVTTLFGAGRHLLTNADWQKIFPPVGTWNKIVYNWFTSGNGKGWIKYSEDLAVGIPLYLKNVAYDYVHELLPPGNTMVDSKDGQDPVQFEQAYNNLIDNLKKEGNGLTTSVSTVNGQQVTTISGNGYNLNYGTGTNVGGIGGSTTSAILIFGVIAAGIFALGRK